MLLLITTLFANLINEGLAFIAEWGFDYLLETVMYAEKSMSHIIAGVGLEGLFQITYNFGVSLVILKFLKKGFDMYVLWTDGDATNDPISLLTNFCKAIVIIVSFPILYELLFNVAQALMNDLGNAMDFAATVSSFVFNAATMGIFSIISILVFIILYIILYVQFLIRGIEMLVLRLGLPLACIGLMDSDGGVFRSYAQKFFQGVLTVIVQVMLVKLATALLVGGDPLWAVATTMLAIKTPKFLNEFMLTSSGGGINIYQTAQTVKMIKGVLRK